MVKRKMNEAVTLKQAVLKLKKVQIRGLEPIWPFAEGLISSISGSRSTFTLGQFGGHAGRTLISGDVLHMGEAD